MINFMKTFSCFIVFLLWAYHEEYKFEYQLSYQLCGSTAEVYFLFFVIFFGIQLVDRMKNKIIVFSGNNTILFLINFMNTFSCFDLRRSRTVTQLFFLLWAYHEDYKFEYQLFLFLCFLGQCMVWLQYWLLRRQSLSSAGSNIFL